MRRFLISLIIKIYTDYGKIVILNMATATWTNKQQQWLDYNDDDDNEHIERWLKGIFSISEIVFIVLH